MSSPSPLDQFCVGTLVASKYVLTSAQCADDRDPSDLHLMIGDHHLGASGETPLNEKRISVQRIIVHESYHPNTRAYDIALLEISERGFYILNFCKTDAQFSRIPTIVNPS